jgi:predicted dehydrogenase
MSQRAYGHTPIQKAFGKNDVYGINYDPERAARRPIKLGIIGAGGIAQSKYLPAIARLRMLWEPIEIAAFAEPRAVQAYKVERIYGGTYYPDYREMLDNENLDGVVVLSPDHLHAEHTLGCLEAGLPVLVELPIARGLEDAERMCKIADERKLTLMTAANKRFSPPYRYAKQALEDGVIVRPALFAGKFNMGYDNVDLFESATIQLFDLARGFMGEVKSVYCIGTNHYRRGGYPIDNATMTLQFASGAVGTLYTSSTALSFKPWERIEIYGDHRWIAVEDQYEFLVYGGETEPIRSWRPVVPHTLGFDEEFSGCMGVIENFVQAIRQKEQARVTGWDGYRAFEILTAAQLSLCRAAPVSLPLRPAAADQEVADWFALHERGKGE